MASASLCCSLKFGETIDVQGATRRRQKYQFQHVTQEGEVVLNDEATIEDEATLRRDVKMKNSKLEEQDLEVIRSRSCCD